MDFLVLSNIAATDIDASPNNQLTYSITKETGVAGAFQIDSSTGALSVKVNLKLLYILCVDDQINNTTTITD